MKIKSFILVLIMTVSVLFNSVNVPAAQSIYSDQLGTNAALGSPLLNASFEVSDWNPYEMIVFGIFLSNFCVNWGEDNYETAFSKNATEGLRGQALDALVFGIGSDTEGTKALKSMLSYAVNAQKQDKHQIFAKFKYSDNGVGVTKTEEYLSDDYEEAKGKALMQLYAQDDSEGLGDTQKTFLDHIWYDGDGTYREILGGGDNKIDFAKTQKVIASTAGLAPYIGIQFIHNPKNVDVELFIKGSAGEMVKVFDSADGWDYQQYTNYLMQGWANGTLRKDDDWFKSIAGSNLYLDCFGNICCDTTKIESAVIFPAACNQYLTQDKSYNYITIGTVNDFYTKASRTDILKYATFNDDGYSYFVDSGEEGRLSTGERIVGFDTNSLIGSYFNEYGVLEMGTGDDASLQANEQWGEALLKLTQSDINSANASPVAPTSFTTLGDVREVSTWYKVYERSAISSFWDHAERIAGIREMRVLTDTAPKRLTKMWTEDGDISIFGNPVYLSGYCSHKRPVVAFGDGVGAPGLLNDAGNALNDNFYSYDKDLLIESLINNMFQYIDGTQGINQSSEVPNLENSIAIKDKLPQYTTVEDAAKYLMFNNGDEGELSDLVKNALYNTYPEYKVSGNTIKSDEGSWHTIDSLTIDLNYATKALSRVLKLYPRSTLMNDVLSEYTAKQGTNFDYLCPNIYITYLQWYGIVGTDGEGLNDAIFQASADILNTDPNALFGDIFLTEEEKKSAVLDYTYLLLNPDETQAKEYKEGLFKNTVATFLYNEYKELSDKTDTAGTDDTSEFLNIPTLAENWMTAWFVQGYTKIVIGLIGIFTVLILIIGIITRKKLHWMLISVGTVVTILLVLPNLGDVTSFICSNIVQRTFENNMDYWVISESASNLTQENTAKAKDLSGDDEDEYLIIANLKKRFNTMTLDSSLMLKNDISKKVNSDFNGLGAEIQNLASARFLLPILMQQYSGNSDSADYLYTSLQAFYDDAQNLYWYYNPGAKLTSHAYNSKDNTIVATSDSEYGTKATILTKSKPSYIYTKYIDVNSGVNNTHTTLDYAAQPEKYFLSLTRTLDPENLTHASYYMVDFSLLGGGSTPFNPYNPDITNLRKAADNMERLASTYEVTSGSPQCYGYLTTTVNPGFYFYMLVRDMCNGMIFKSDKLIAEVQAQNQSQDDADAGAVGGGGAAEATVSPTSLSSLVSNLQGKVFEYVDTSDDPENPHMTLVENLPEDYDYDESDVVYKRESFMHADGYIRDFLDMEELFTNVIPYMYDMYHAAAGDTENKDTGQMEYTITDDHGREHTNPSIFQPDEMMTNYPIYKNNPRSWLWRCNWAIKLVEGKDLNRETKVSGRDNSGNRVKYDLTGDPIDPRSYPAQRPMVFSEAQMHMQNLEEADLTIPELKILKVNSEVEKKWTYLLNYANTASVTEETFYRIMALDALFAFDTEFDTSRLFNSSKALYPRTVDLRNLSFDSVVKLLMISSTKNTSYIGADAIQSVIDQGYIIRTYTLLAAAFLANIIVPVVRSIFLGLIFYLLLWIVITNIFSGATTKKNILVGYLISTGVFSAINILYFLVYKLLIQVSSIDTVLITDAMTGASVSPAVIFLVIIIACLLNIGFTVALTITVIKNRRDMGYAKFMFIGKQFTDSMSRKMHAVADKFRSSETGRGYGASSGGSAEYSESSGSSGRRRRRKNDEEYDTDDADMSSKGSGSGGSRRSGGSGGTGGSGTSDTGGSSGRNHSSGEAPDIRETYNDTSPTGNLLSDQTDTVKDLEKEINQYNEAVKKSMEQQRKLEKENKKKEKEAKKEEKDKKEKIDKHDVS